MSFPLVLGRDLVGASPLLAALESRPGSDHRELARMAHQPAATRA